MTDQIQDETKPTEEVVGGDNQTAGAMPVEGTEEAVTTEAEKVEEVASTEGN